MNEGMKREKRRGTGRATTLAAVLLAGMLLLGNGALASQSASPDAPNATASTATPSTDVRARWKDDAWEYSLDNGETWTDEVPEGVTVHGDQSLTLLPGNDTSGGPGLDAWEQGFSNWLASIYQEADNIISDALPSGSQDWGSFVRFGDTLARQNDENQWEYSTDGGETWTDEAPEGVSVSEGGTGLRFSSGESSGGFWLEGF